MNHITALTTKCSDKVLEFTISVKPNGKVFEAYLVAIYTSMEV